MTLDSTFSDLAADEKSAIFALTLLILRSSCLMSKTLVLVDLVFFNGSHDEEDEDDVLSVEHLRLSKF